MHYRSELFQDSESFLNDLTDVDIASVEGSEYGIGTLLPYLAYGNKFLEYGITGYGINAVVSLTKSFSIGYEATYGATYDATVATITV